MPGRWHCRVTRWSHQRTNTKPSVQVHHEGQTARTTCKAQDRDLHWCGGREEKKPFCRQMLCLPVSGDPTCSHLQHREAAQPVSTGPPARSSSAHSTSPSPPPPHPLLDENSATSDPSTVFTLGSLALRRARNGGKIIIISQMKLNE